MNAPSRPGTRATGFAFVGRRPELARAVAALAVPPAVLLVEGESGIGKSRLVAEALAAVRTRVPAARSGPHPDRPVLTGYCHPLREPLPYGPVVDALRGVAALLPSGTALPPSAGALRRVLPDLAPVLPPDPADPADGAASARHLLVQGVRALLGALGEVILLVEDLHWADEETRELLLQLARDMPPQLTLVLTYRPEDLPAGTPLLGAAYRRAPGVGGDLLRLGPLSETDVHDLARTALGTRATPELVRVLFDRSQGLPLVAEEDLITIAERPAPAGRAGGDAVAELEHGEVPQGLRDAVEERLARLGPAGSAVVAAAAVLGVQADEDLLAAVSGLDHAAAADGLTEALAAAVVRESAPDRYTFRHALAQQVVYRGLPGPRRRALHRRAIAVLEAREPRPLVQIAHHTLAMGDRRAWQDLAQAAADQAVALGDTGSAVTMLRSLLEVADLDARRRGRAALTLARIAANDVDPVASTHVLSGMIADPRLPVADRGEIRLALGFLTAVHSGNRAGFDRIREALDELQERPVRAARAMVAIAMDEREEGGRQSWEWLARAERLLERSPDEEVAAAVRATELTFMARDGDPAVWERLAELPRSSERAEVLRQTTRALYNTGEIAIELGHDRRAGHLLAESRRLARLAAIPYLECYSRLALIRLDALAGRWDDMEERFASLGAEFDDLAMAGAERSLLIGRTAAARGRLAQAREEFEVAARFGRRESQVTAALRAAAGYAGLQLAEGDAAGAAGTVRPAVDAARHAGAWARTAELLPVAVEALLATGEPGPARELAEEAAAALAGRDAPAASAGLDLARGLLLAAAGEDGAEDAFAEARDRWREIGRPYEAARAEERIGVALAAHDRARAGERIAAAEKVYRDLAATYDTARCQKLRRVLDLGGTVSPGRRGYGRRLSPRERQVAELLAQGAGNQDIAQALFLSPRTVEHHVANVLHKLGTSRADAAQALADADADGGAPGDGRTG
ncbi:ATP-binding protein [Kitasatospora sp. NPDC054939]